MGLVDYLKMQIEFCNYNYNYKCGVFVSSFEKRKIVMDTISKILPVPNHNVELRVSSNEAIARFKNGSLIRIIPMSQNARGLKLNGGIIDNEIDSSLVETIIFPCMMPLTSSIVDGTENKDKPISRVFLSKISYDDVNEASRKYNYETTEDIRNAINASIKRYIDKEYEKMFKNCYETSFDNYDMPFKTREINNSKILFYKAYGIPKAFISHETEFVNKSKQTYLNVKGSYENGDIDFKNDINIHLLIDTDVYSGYEVDVADGIVKITLREIENEVPVLTDFSTN